MRCVADQPAYPSSIGGAIDIRGEHSVPERLVKTTTPVLKRLSRRVGTDDLQNEVIRCSVAQWSPPRLTIWTFAPDSDSRGLIRSALSIEALRVMLPTLRLGRLALDRAPSFLQRCPNMAPMRAPRAKHARLDKPTSQDTLRHGHRRLRQLGAIEGIQTPACLRNVPFERHQGFSPQTTSQTQPKNAGAKAASKTSTLL